MHVVITIPTYNERESTATLFAQLASHCPHWLGHRVSVLYVDSGSTDGTREIIRENQENFSWLHLVEEPSRSGLGSAYSIGMQYAMSELSADFIMEFDGDLQHRVADIPLFLKEIDRGADYVIGSRFIPGGSIPASWGIHRKLLSTYGNYIARCILKLPNVHDVTSGFKLSRVKGFLDSFDFSSLLSDRHAYKVHLLYYMIQRGAKVKEVPIIFEPRSGGESKLITNDILDTLRVAFTLRKQGVARE